MTMTANQPPRSGLNPTHDPRRKSWVASANLLGAPFPIQNLPFGLFLPPQASPQDRQVPAAIGVAIGDQILDLRSCQLEGLFSSLPGEIGQACAARTLNPLMALGPACWSPLRSRLSDLLRSDHPQAASHEQQLQPLLLHAADVRMLKPAIIGGYTDFYASLFHAINVGRLFRPENPLLPNYKHVPIGYHGRTSSLVVSGTPIRRPHGQIVSAPGAAPQFEPSRWLDYELEIGFFAGPGNLQGQRIAINQAESHIFGVCLLNDWSARDIQAWEYQPLGPFLSKNFATSLSPWIVTMEALAPFRAPAFARPVGDPAPLPYLHSESNQQQGAIELTLEVYLRSTQMRESGSPPARMSRGSSRHLYWTPAQLLTHHASNGCNLEPGDLLASGAISGPQEDSLGCLLELTRRGANPFPLPSGELRTSLEDGDEVTLRGYSEREGFVSIGLGECTGVVFPA